MIKATARPVRCKACGEPFVRSRPMQKACSRLCALMLVNLANAKKEARAKVAERKADRAKLRAMRPLRDFIADTQEACNRYVRLRDFSLPCVSCQRFHEGQWHAGHYRSTAAAPELRFDLDNLARQCSPCNTHLSGNLINYRAGLVKRIGIHRVLALEGPHPAQKWTREELVDMRDKFRAMARELESKREEIEP